MTSDELAAKFGGLEQAATITNAYACNLEDKLQVLDHQLQQLAQAVQVYQAREENFNQFFQDPGKVADYYLELEKIYNEIPVDQPQAQPPLPMEQYAQFLPPGAGLPQNQTVPVPPQAIQRPVFPQMPVGVQGGQVPTNLQSVPAHQRWRLIDQAAQAGGLRGVRLF